MQKITVENIDALKIGAGILGTGGGGDPYVGALIVKLQLEKYGPVNLINVDELTNGDVVVPVGFVGAPSVSIEQLESGDEFMYIFDEIQKYTGKRPTVIMPTEIGGANAFAPFYVAGKMGIPILDADSMGRAFPELQMVSFSLFDIAPQPAYLSDFKGNTAIIQARNNADNNLMIENLGRAITVSMGSNAALVLCTLTAKQAKKTMLPNTVSYAIEIGESVINARKTNQDPIKAIIEKTGGAIIGSGVIEDVDQKIESGFLRGTVTVVNGKNNETCSIEYQNENLVLKKNGNIVATTPDLIVIVDSQTGAPIITEALKYGLRVSILIIPCDDMWKTKEGLALVGPRYFGYDIDYKPFIPMITLERDQKEIL